MVRMDKIKEGKGDVERMRQDLEKVERDNIHMHSLLRDRDIALDRAENLMQSLEEKVQLLEGKLKSLQRVASDHQYCVAFKKHRDIDFTN
jgi:hypothetical protein